VMGAASRAAGWYRLEEGMRGFTFFPC
jgi:hypothetical protein